MSDQRPITHPLAIAYFELARAYWLATRDTLGDEQHLVSRRWHKAGEAWRAAGCPLYREDEEDP